MTVFTTRLSEVQQFQHSFILLQRRTDYYLRTLLERQSRISSWTTWKLLRTSPHTLLRQMMQWTTSKRLEKPSTYSTPTLATRETSILPAAAMESSKSWRSSSFWRSMTLHAVLWKSLRCDTMVPVFPDYDMSIVRHPHDVHANDGLGLGTLCPHREARCRIFNSENWTIRRKSRNLRGLCTRRRATAVFSASYSSSVQAEGTCPLVYTGAFDRLPHRLYKHKLRVQLEWHIVPQVGCFRVKSARYERYGCVV